MGGAAMSRISTRSHSSVRHCACMSMCQHSRDCQLQGRARPCPPAARSPPVSPRTSPLARGRRRRRCGLRCPPAPAPNGMISGISNNAGAAVLGRGARVAAACAVDVRAAAPAGSRRSSRSRDARAQNEPDRALRYGDMHDLSRCMRGLESSPARVAEVHLRNLAY